MAEVLAETDLPKGTLWVPARQRLGRLAAQLLEPESEDFYAWPWPSDARLTADPAVYRQTSHRAFAHAHTNLTWDSWARSIEELSRDVSGRALAA